MVDLVLIVSITSKLHYSSMLQTTSLEYSACRKYYNKHTVDRCSRIFLSKGHSQSHDCVHAKSIWSAYICVETNLNVHSSRSMGFASVFNHCPNCTSCTEQWLRGVSWCIVVEHLSELLFRYQHLVCAMLYFTLFKNTFISAFIDFIYGIFGHLLSWRLIERFASVLTSPIHELSPCRTNTTNKRLLL